MIKRTKNELVKLQIGKAVLLTEKFDDTDLDLIMKSIGHICRNEFIDARLTFSKLIIRIQYRNAIQNFLDGINDNN